MSQFQVFVYLIAVLLPAHGPISLEAIRKRPIIADSPQHSMIGF